MKKYSRLSSAAVMNGALTPLPVKLLAIPSASFLDYYCNYFNP